MYEVKGKNVLITGSASGIGKELSLLFARDGANMILDDMPENKAILDQWASELKSRFNARVWTFGINLAEESGAETLYKSSLKAAGKIDILVNDAGKLTYGTLLASITRSRILW